MIENKIAEFFYKHPSKKPHLRALARACNISPAAALYATKKLIKKNILKKETQKPLTTFTVGKEFTTHKRIWNLEQLYKKKIIEKLKQTRPQAIIVFGSYSRGEDWEESDIDIAIIKPQKKIDYNKTIQGRVVNILYLNEKIPEELQNNIINGIPLYGRWDPIFDHSNTI